MNRQQFQQTGGFPLTTNTLNFAQASWLLMQEFGRMGGDLTILSGCEVNGSQVSDGTVYINGEIMPFVGGMLGANVVVQETRSAKAFEDGIARDVEIVRVARFGNGLETYPWSEFERLMPIKQLQKALTPVGLIAMWSGELIRIPEGWVLCDGMNGTPNLSNKFVRGFDTDAYRIDQNNNNMGATGGADEVVLQNVNMPPHDHGGSVQSDGEHYHMLENYDTLAGANVNATDATRGNLHYGEVGTGSRQSFNGTKRGGVHTHAIYIDGGLNGEAQPFDNRPAYYTLAFIMYKGY